jgi:hypothetical protein
MENFAHSGSPSQLIEGRPRLTRARLNRPYLGFISQIKMKDRAKSGSTEGMYRIAL